MEEEKETLKQRSLEKREDGFLGGWTLFLSDVKFGEKWENPVRVTLRQRAEKGKGKEEVE